MKTAAKEKLVHLSAFAFLIVVIIRLSFVGQDADLSPAKTHPHFMYYKKFSMRFLTKWTFGMLFTYYTCMVITHALNLISPASKLSYKLRKFADALFTIIVLPSGMFITTFFWIIFNYDRELIFPSWLDGIIPCWINHGLHTFNSVFPLLDLLLVKHTFSPWSDTIFYSALYFGSYLVCLFGTYFQYGIWLYPIFSKMTLFQSFCFCLTGYSMVLLCHYTARSIGMRTGMSSVKVHQKGKNQYSYKTS